MAKASDDSSIFNWLVCFQMYLQSPNLCWFVTGKGERLSLRIGRSVKKPRSQRFSTTALSPCAGMISLISLVNQK